LALWRFDPQLKGDEAMTKNVSRRAMLAGASAVPAIAIAPSITAAGEPDPIFAAIERYRKTSADFITLCRAEDDLREKGVSQSRLRGPAHPRDG
jgi:hypothetical protein